MNNEKSLIPLSEAVETIKTAILQGQYEALKDVNRVQLAVYFAIGKYLSNNTRRLPYGASALKAISEQLHKEMPGLRGFSETSLKKMRLFFEHWKMLDAKSCVATHDSQKTESCVMTHDMAIAPSTNSLGNWESNKMIDIYHSIAIPNIAEFPVEDFFLSTF